MGRRITDGSYEVWLNHVFDHVVSDPEWHWADDPDVWGGEAKTTASYLARTFREAGGLPKRFSDEQLRIGINYLVSNSCSDHFYALLDEKVSWETRKDGLAAIYHVFADLFAPRCSEHLSHLDERETGVLNGICYMWWDVAPVHPEPDQPAYAGRDTLLLKIMEDTLALNSEACRESALHGLGHWQIYYPDKVKAIIHDFIWNNRQIRDPLRNYAYAAMSGDIL